jgi:iron complex outermembrane receptor protein
MYVDGVYYPTPNASIFALDDIRQIEVLKGPQGTLFGRNATGGVIQVETRNPEAEPSAELRLEYGSYARKRASVYATGGVGKSSSAGISLYSSDQDHGWGTNLETGVPTFRLQESGGRGKFLWQPTEQTRLSFSASYLRHSGEDGLGYHIVPGSLAVDGQTQYSGFYNRRRILKTTLRSGIPCSAPASSTNCQP